MESNAPEEPDGDLVWEVDPLLLQQLGALGFADTGAAPLRPGPLIEAGRMWLERNMTKLRSVVCENPVVSGYLKNRETLREYRPLAEYLASQFLRESVILSFILLESGVAALCAGAEKVQRREVSSVQPSTAPPVTPK